jgi:hypothetical protein
MHSLSFAELPKLPGLANIAGITLAAQQIAAIAI